MDFNRKQRFSLRKLSVGVASVLLGTFVVATNHSVSADSSSTTESTTVAKTEEASVVEGATNETFAGANDALEIPAATAPATKSAKEEAKVDAKAETKTETVIPSASTEVKVETQPAIATSTPAAKEEAPAVEAKKEVKAEENEASRNVGYDALPVERPATAAMPRDERNGRPYGRSGSSLRGADSALSTDGENVTLPAKDTVTPDIENPNGATIGTRQPAAPYKLNPDTSKYTYYMASLDGGVNAGSSTNSNRYIRLSKAYDDSPETTVEVVEKNTGNVLETKTLTMGQTIKLEKTNNSNYFVRLTMGAQTSKSGITYTQVTGSFRKDDDTTLATLQVFSRYDVLAPVKVGEQLDQFSTRVPKTASQITYYKEVDPTNPSYDPNNLAAYEGNYTDKETVISTFTQKAMEGQIYTPSGQREFTDPSGKKAYIFASDDLRSEIVVGASYKVGDKYVQQNNAENQANKIATMIRTAEFIHPDGTQKIAIYIMSPEGALKGQGVGAGQFPDSNYMKVFETIIKPDSYNETAFSKPYTFTWTENGQQKSHTFNLATGAHNGQPNGLIAIQPQIDITGPNNYKFKLGGTNGVLRNEDLKAAVAFYYYAPVGNVEVHYEDTKGNVLKDKIVITEDPTLAGKPVNTPYDTVPKRDVSITKDGKVYRLVSNDPKQGSATETGKVEKGTKKVTYVYDEIKNNVKVNYVDLDGNALKASQDVFKEKQSAQTPYDATTDAAGTATVNANLKPATITVGDKTYKLTEKTTMKNGTAISGSVKAGSAPTSGQDAKIAVDPTKDQASQVVPEITYVYELVETPKVEKKGSVVVKYVNNATGEEIETEVPDSTDLPVGTHYETFDHKPTTIKKGDKEYKLVTTNDGVYAKTLNGKVSDPQSGNIAEGTKTVIYAYEEVKKGDVVVKYQTTDGTELVGKGSNGENIPKGGVEDTPTSPVDTAYNTKDHKPETITTADGTVYRLVPTETKGKEEGKVVEGTTTITYVYEKVVTPTPEKKGSVIVKYVKDEDGTELAKEVIDVQDGVVGSQYDTTDHKPKVLEKDDKLYDLVTVETTNTNANGTYKNEVDGVRSADETGLVEEGTKTIIYAYKERPTPVAEKGSVFVKYVDNKTGKEILNQVTDTDNKPVGTPYETNDKKVVEFKGTDGKTYRIIPNNNGVYEKELNGKKSDPESGEVTKNPKTVIYAYEEVTGNVVVKYKTIDGVELIGTGDNNLVVPVGGVTDTPNSSVGTPYNTQEDNRPNVITTANGDKYELVAGVTQGTEVGKVVEGTTTITYFYKKVETPTPVVKQQADVVVVAVEADGTTPLTKGRTTAGENQEIPNGILESVMKLTDGMTGDIINADGKFDKAAVIKKYQKLGYKVVLGSYGDATELTDKEVFDNVKDNIQHFVVKLTPIVVPVTPDKPVKPGDPVPNIPNDPQNPTPETPTYPNPNPNTPDDPINPVVKDPEQMKGTKKRIVQYFKIDENGQEVPLASDPKFADKEDTLNFEKKGTINLVTGTTTLGNWEPKNGTTFNNYPSPTLEGYTPDKIEEGKHENITEPGENIVDKVVYRPIAKPVVVKQKADVTVVAVKEDGTPLTPAEDLGKQVKDANGLLEKSSEFEGQAGDKVTGFNREEAIAKYQKLGYKYVPGNKAGFEGEYDGNNVYDNTEGNVQHFVIKVTPVIVPVTPDKPVKPGEPVPNLPKDPNNPEPKTPNYPEPKDPATKDPKQLQGTSTRVVKYFKKEADGSLTPLKDTKGFEDKTDTLNYEKTGTVNLVTGETTLSDWTPKNGTEFKNYTSPELAGYTPDKTVAGEHTDITTPGQKLEDVVIYTPNPVTPPVVEEGSVVVHYKDTEGNVLKNPVTDTPNSPVKTPYDTTDNRPEELTDKDGNKYKRVPNLTEGDEKGTVEKGEKKVTYVYQLVQQADVTVIAVDENGKPLTSGRTEAGQGQSLTDGKLEVSKVFEGGAGETVTGFDREAAIKKYQKLGYKYVPGNSNGYEGEYNGSNVYDKVKGNVQHFVIKVTPVIVPVTPEVPVVPGKPVPPTVPNKPEVPVVPNDPNNPTPETPTYPTPDKPNTPTDPNGTVPEDLKGTKTRIVKYYKIDENGNKVPLATTPGFEDKKDTLNFEKKGTINLVTGKVEIGNWTPKDGTEFNNYTSPTLEGYTPDKNEEGRHTGITTPGGDIVDEVIYRPNPVTPPATPEDKAVIIYRHVQPDGTTVVKELEKSSEVTGKKGEEVKLTTEETIKKYEKLGYKLVKDGFTKGATYNGEPGTDTYYVDLTPRIVPVTPEKPLVPGKPVDPNNPDSPNYPDPKDPNPNKPGSKDELTKLTEEVKRDVKYYVVDKDGNNKRLIENDPNITTKEDVLKFRREGSINLVTGETTLGEWELADKDGKKVENAGSTGDFHNYDTQVKKGYLADKAKEGEHKGIHATDQDIHDEVLYRPMGVYYPKFPDGKIPNDPTPWEPVPYPNDPTDPTKPLTPENPSHPPIPHVPGLVPKDPGTGEPLKPIDPNDPTKGYHPPTPKTPFEDTPIPYELPKNPDPNKPIPPKPPVTPTPDKPVPPVPGKPVTPPATPEEPAKPVTPAPALPATGEETNSAALIAAAVAALGAAGLVVARKKDEE